MKCADVRAMAESYLAGELPVDTSHAILAHLERCPSCRTELEARRALQQTLRHAFRASADLAPDPRFLARVEARLGNSDTRRQFSVSARWLALAACLIVIVGTAWQLRRVMLRSEAPATTAAALAAHAAGDHRYCALEHALEEAPITLEEAARRYGAIYARLREVVAESAPVRDGELTLLGAHWCVFKGRPFAHVVVRRKDSVVSILLTPSDAIDAGDSEGPAAYPVDDGFQVAGFAARGHFGFVVSALTEDENLALARELAPIVQRYFLRT